jgi:hypothetical protein
MITFEGKIALEEKMDGSETTEDHISNQAIRLGSDHTEEAHEESVEQKALLARPDDQSYRGGACRHRRCKRGGTRSSGSGQGSDGHWGKGDKDKGPAEKLKGEKEY